LWNALLSYGFRKSLVKGVGVSFGLYGCDTLGYDDYGMITGTKGCGCGGVCTVVGSGLDAIIGIEIGMNGVTTGNGSFVSSSGF
jgi:hypothetical protein